GHSFSGRLLSAVTVQYIERWHLLSRPSWCVAHIYATTVVKQGSHSAHFIVMGIHTMDEAIQLDREDVILLMLEANERILRKDALSGITRLEKLLFLLERETDFEGIATFFEFEAHNFGPFSKEVYEAVEFLLGCDLIEVCDKTYSSVYSNSDEAKLLSEISEGDEAENLDSSSLQMTEKQ